MQGIPENSTFSALSRGIGPGGMLGAGLPGMPLMPTSNTPPKDGSATSNDGNPNENGIKTAQELEIRTSKIPSNSEDLSPHEAAAKLIRKNQIIARLDIVCLVLFPIVFLLYSFIYLMSTCA